MNDKEIFTLVEFLDDYSDRLGNDGCNDWDFPDNWSLDERNEFVKDYHTMNGDPDEYSYSVSPNIQNFCAVSLLAYKLTNDE